MNKDKFYKLFCDTYINELVDQEIKMEKLTGYYNRENYSFFDRLELFEGLEWLLGLEYSFSNVFLTEYTAFLA